MSNKPIKTERLILRNLTSDDAQAMFDNWCNDPEVTKFLTFLPHENIEVTKGVLANWLKEYEDPKTIRYGITLKSDGKLIGTIDVVKYIDGYPEIGCCLSHKYWNQGYMTEACKALMQYLFDLGYDKIIMGAKDENIGSNRVIRKCGFRFTHQETRNPWSVYKTGSGIINWYEKTK